MPTIVRETTFGAAGSNANVNAGSVFETARRRQVLSMAIVTTVAANLALINVGADVVAEEFTVGVLATYPIVPDHFVFTDVAEVGDRIVIAVRATIATVYRSIVIAADA
jgi:hypothetical protein